MIIELNDDLPLVFDFPNYEISVWDRKYDHVWYLDPSFSDLDKIWVWRIPATEPCCGVKDMGYIKPNLSKTLDVVFISYHEINAEQNWERLLSKVPNARRVDNVKGILEAHQAAARVATTDMFYVVDGDAYILDDFEFDFSPSIFDRNCVYVYHSMNPINQLSYGYGGVKIFPKKELLASQTARTDITTSVTPKFKVIDKLSNITAFNTDAFSAWRSGFRECAKLASGTIDNNNLIDNLQRLHIWKTIGHSNAFGMDAIEGATLGAEFGSVYKLDPDKLELINNRDWLKELYDNSRQRRI
jgi:hypothetical protein